MSNGLNIHLLEHIHSTLIADKMRAEKYFHELKGEKENGCSCGADIERRLQYAAKSVEEKITFLEAFESVKWR